MTEVFENKVDLGIARVDYDPVGYVCAELGLRRQSLLLGAEEAIQRALDDENLQVASMTVTAQEHQ